MGSAGEQVSTTTATTEATTLIPLAPFPRAAQVAQALAGLSWIGSTSNVTVDVREAPTPIITITFIGARANTDVPLLRTTLVAHTPITTRVTVESLVRGGPGKNAVQSVTFAQLPSAGSLGLTLVTITSAVRQRETLLGLDWLEARLRNDPTFLLLIGGRVHRDGGPRYMPNATPVLGATIQLTADDDVLGVGGERIAVGMTIQVTIAQRIAQIGVELEAATQRLDELLGNVQATHWKSGIIASCVKRRGIQQENRASAGVTYQQLGASFDLIVQYPDDL